MNASWVIIKQYNNNLLNYSVKHHNSITLRTVVNMNDMDKGHTKSLEKSLVGSLTWGIMLDIDPMTI